MSNIEDEDGFEGEYEKMVEDNPSIQRAIELAKQMPDDALEKQISYATMICMLLNRCETLEQAKVSLWLTTVTLKKVYEERLLERMMQAPTPSTGVC